MKVKRKVETEKDQSYSFVFYAAQFQKTVSNKLARDMYLYWLDSEKPF